MVTTPLVGAMCKGQIDDVVASLSITLSDEEVRRLEAPYTPRNDFQGISEDRGMRRIMTQILRFVPASS